jgi:hypothetical protein
MIRAERERLHGATAAEVDLRRGGGPCRRRTDAEVSPGVDAPAFDLIVVEERTTEGVARCYGLRRPPGTEIHLRQVVAHLVRTIAAVRGVADAELTEVVEAPTLDLIVIEERAGVVAARGERERRARGPRGCGSEVQAR